MEFPSQKPSGDASKSEMDVAAQSSGRALNVTTCERERRSISYTSVCSSHGQECLKSVGTFRALSKSIALITVCRSGHLLFMAVEAEGEERGGL